MQTSKIFITTAETLDVNGQRPVNFTFDCVVEYSPTFKRSISSYPVSTRSNFGDHIFSETTTLSLVGMVSATPLQGVIPNNLIDTEVGLARVQRAHDELKRLHLISQPLTLVTEFDVIDNLYLTDLHPVQDNNAILFNLSFQQMKFARYKSVALIRDLSSNLAADGATTNDGSGSRRSRRKKKGKGGGGDSGGNGDSPEWGYEEKGNWDWKEKSNGMKTIDPASSVGQKVSDIASNLMKQVEQISGKLMADPVKPKL